MANIKRPDPSTKHFIRLIFQYATVLAIALLLNTGIQYKLISLMDDVHKQRADFYTLEKAGASAALEEVAVDLSETEDLYELWLAYSRLYLMIVPGIIAVYLLIVTLVGMRRIKINSNELQTSVVMAEKANEAKSVFLANMSHEIRTPLNAIIGFADILKKDLVDGKNREYAEVIHRSANMLLSIINDILDLSKIESGKIILELRPFDIHELLRRVVDLYTVRADQKGLRMVYVVDKNVPKRIIGDSLRLQQVVSNLLGNAIKFTPEGGTVTLSAVCLQQYEERVYLDFTVKDTGVGIPKEAQEKIFKPFSQADGGVSRTFGGTGLGLTISQKILQAMQSHLELESYLGKGTTFNFKVYFELDLRLEAEPKGNKPVIGIYPKSLAQDSSHESLIALLKSHGEVVFSSHLRGDENVQLYCLFGHNQVMEDYHTLRLYYPKIPVVYVGDRHYLSSKDLDKFDGFCQEPVSESYLNRLMERLLKPKNAESISDVQYEGRVLVAEDNTTNRLLIQILLEKAGLIIDYAKDGYEAVNAVKHREYDLIFMDIHMPKKDGVTATKEIMMIEKDEHRLHVPIVALTANALKGDRERYISEGMDDYMSKPISEGQLMIILNKYMTALPNKLSRKGSKVQQGKARKDPMPKVTRSVYDPERAAAKVGVDRLTLDMLLENFFYTFDRDFDKLKDAVRKMDDEAAASAAHFIKGASMNLFIDEGTKMLKEAEALANSGASDAINLVAIEQYFKSTRNQLGIR